MLATREDPPFPLARFRGQGTLLAITDDDLRFSLEDASRLLKEYDAPALSDEDLRALIERTEGWAVGLKMAALSLKDRPDATGFIASFTGNQRYIMDYLLEEVLHHQPGDIQDFLLTTSILERLTGPLCDALTGDTGGAERLASLERDNLFIQPLDDKHEWYRYEHLFADLLRHQLLTVNGTARVRELHGRASAWDEQHGDLYAAVEHALQAEDWENAVRLLERPEMDHVRTMEAVSLSRLIKRIPEEVLLQHAELLLNYCSMIAASGKAAEAETHLDSLERAAGADRRLLGMAAISRIYIAKWCPTAARYSYKEAVRRAQDVVSEDDPVRYGALCAELGWSKMHSPGDVKAAESLFLETLRCARETGALFFEINTCMFLATIERKRGNLRHVADMCRQAIERGSNLPVTITAHVQLGIVLYEWNELDEAAREFQTSLEYGRHFGVIQARAWVRSYLAFIRYAQGDDAGARDLFEQADFQANRILTTPFVRTTYTCPRLDFAIWHDTLAEAEQWGERLQEDSAAIHYDEHLRLIRLLIARGKKAEAAAALRAMYEGTLDGKAPGDPAKLNLYRALAAESEAAALDFLDGALAWGEREGYVRTFVDEQRAAKPLLQKALAKGIHPEYVRRLLDVMEKESLQRKTAGDGQPLLSARELEILKLMAADTPNQDIGERLAISLSTVKTHVHHILEKLEAADRSQAVYRARELGIL